jgi:cellobiose phosphorylase
LKKYGHFSDDRMEFIITRPDTPRSWVNYISNGRYSGLISHVAGGYSFYGNPKDNRITRWRYNALPQDRPGRYILIRDAQTGEYWSPSWQPTLTDLDSFTCAHGLFYTRISSQYQDLQAKLLYFVPPDDDLEIWQLRLSNAGMQPVQLDLFAFQELCLGHALVDLINQPNDQHFNDVHFDRQAQALFATKRYWVKYKGATVKQANEAWDKVVFFAATEQIKGWDGSKDLFIGSWNSEANPMAVERGGCGNSEITSGDAIAALQLEVRLNPGETRDLAFLMGIVPRENYRENVRPLLLKYRSLANILAEYQRLREAWHSYLAYVQIEVPDDDMQTMINVWNQYQTVVTFLYSRDASYYHGGLLFGRGYRDSCQDIMGPVIARPDWVRKRIVEMARYQFFDGSTFHLYYPQTGGGEKTGHSDTPLWLPLAITVYLKETGDFKFLEAPVPFYDEGEDTILEHLIRAIDFTLANLTERHLAKFGPGDWNDTLDYLGRGGRGESVWVSMFLAYILQESIGLYQYIGDHATVERFQVEYQKVKQAVNELCWDGKWYIRGTNDERKVIGSSRNEEGRIFLNTQSWAVISGIADAERALQCMESVQEHLETPKGPKILHPAYTKVDDTIGLATRCVPGKKENGAVFNHPVSWSILAECLLGHGNRAFEIYQKALPMNPVIDIDRYEVEPYVYAEYVTSPDHPTFGQASHSWLTGSSTWMLRGALDYILGIKPTYCGLRIEPCIPSHWKSYCVKRCFRGIDYEIAVLNPENVQKGVREVKFEGIKLTSNLIDLNDPQIQRLVKGKTRITLTVRLGK